MMIRWALHYLLLTTTAFADVGQVVKLVGADDAYLLRGKDKVSLAVETVLEQGDEVYSSNAHVVILLHPSVQLSLPKLSEIKIIEAVIKSDENYVKNRSIVELIKGQIRALVTKQDNQENEHRVISKNVSFAVRGTEFEVAIHDDEVNLDVVEGEVEFSSPLVHTFVPEIIRAREGFQFNRRMKQFKRRKFAPRLNGHPGFLKRDELRERWAKRKVRKALRREKIHNKDKKFRGRLKRS